MNEELATALTVVLRDLRATCAVQPNVREELDFDEAPLVMLYEADGSGVGVSVPEGAAPAEQVAELAEQVKDWAVEALASQLLPATWPECPDHPASHPLAAEVVGGTAVWSCPRSRRVVAPVGALAEPGRASGGRRGVSS
ncbi:hypothetical protein ABT390_15370 [Streptomyces aurantiacus]|uniref:Uncharacterized protein n=1 Tax=Streptomyces aurantiacus JA 4570 TaxID=1286094 RepID=S3ZLV0_9ACTN|nr:hypothetical protein [Streptomyces aurantiacus]EPH44496.1 hypothetical protein STRAU_2441 [Streptomyces aurantiacus JA 4570]